MRYFFSVDLGTMQDYTAISIVERVPRRQKLQSLPGTHERTLEKPKYTAVYIMRHLERLPLGMDYVAIVERLRGMLSHEKLVRQTVLTVDATGVGTPIVQMMQQAGMAPIGVTITTGSVVTNGKMGGYNVPKGELVSALNLVFQARRIKIPRALSLKSEFLKELERFKVTVSNTGINTYEAAVASVHDDLVLSTAMGVWYAEKTEGQTFTQISTGGTAKTLSNPLEAL